jgi:hypothetical protein
MKESEWEARKLIGDDWSSWGARRRAHKAYKQMALRPEEEVPRHRSPRKSKKKHVHKWGEWIVEGIYLKTIWHRTRSKIKYVETPKRVRICKKCGHRDREPRYYW